MSSVRASLPIWLLRESEMESKYGKFSGEPKTTWKTEDGKADRHMVLIEPFSYQGKVMDVTAPTDFRIDGASIPRALWTLVGSPYTGDYRRASIVHDKACCDAAGDPKKRRTADRMFFYACLAGGCSLGQAIVLYIGVRMGAALGRVSYWNEPRGSEAEPRLFRSRADQAIERDFSVAADLVRRPGETDDAAEIEKRTDEALEMLTGVVFREA